MGGAALSHRKGRRNSGTKKRNGRTACAVTAVPYMDRLESGRKPPFFSFLATGWLIRRSGGRGKAPVLIPRPDGRPTWFIHAGAASRIGSRTDPSHCTPRRQVGAGGARDWPHLFGPVITRFSDSRNERASRSSPLPSRPNCCRFTEAPCESNSAATPPIYGPRKNPQVPDFIRFTRSGSGAGVDREVRWNKD
jgi:hypothetical protein